MVLSTSRSRRTAAAAADRPRRLFAWAFTLACVGGLTLFIDLQAARWCKAGGISGDFLRFLNFCEVCGHGFGVAAILLAAVVLDRTLGGRTVAARFLGLPLSRDFVRMVAAAYTGGILANVIKATLVDRVRPRAADLASAASALATFGDSVAATISSHSDVNSFPSGHAATAAGLAAALTWKYPHGRWFFGALAAGAAAQRIATSAHYPSDVLLGAALGLAAAAAVLGRSIPGAEPASPARAVA